MKGALNFGASRVVILAFVCVTGACSVAPVQVEDATSSSSTVEAAADINHSAPRVISPAKSEDEKARAASDVLLQQAYEQYDHDRWQQAVQLAERGLRIDRYNAHWHLLLAKCYTHLGDDERAQEFVSQGLAYAPSGKTSLRKGLQALMLGSKP